MKKKFSAWDFDRVFREELGLYGAAGADALYDAYDIYGRESNEDFFAVVAEKRNELLERVNAPEPPYDPIYDPIFEALIPYAGDEENDGRAERDEAAELADEELYFRCQVHLIAEKFNNEIVTLVYRSVSRERAVALVEAMKGLKNYSQSVCYGTALITLLPSFEEGLSWGEFAMKWNQYNPECDEIPVPQLEIF